MAMNILRLTRDGLIDYTVRQLAHFFPDGRSIDQTRIATNMGETLGRLEKCINCVAAWPREQFDHLHSSQYCTYLYYLSNTIWKNNNDIELSTRLFLLNKLLNSIDLFYEIEMPEIFFIGHSIGIVLAKATYGDYLVLYQNTTVGRNYEVYPVLGEGVVLYPGSSIIGRCRIGDRTILSAGTQMLNHDAPGNCVAFGGQAGALTFKPPARDVLGDFFRV
jgi:serine O-acetyltransferase